MKYAFYFLLLLSFNYCFSQTLSPNQAKDYIGKKITICGQVSGSYYSYKTKGKPTFLDMGGKYPASTFTVLIWSNYLNKFKYDLKELDGKNICVTGFIKEYKGKPEVVVSDPNQIKTE